MQTPQDILLIQIEKKSDDTFFLAGIELTHYNGKLAMSNASYNPNDLTRIYGTAVSLPKSFSNERMILSEMTLSDCIPEVQLGDRVYFYYNCMQDDNIIMIDGKAFLKVPYDRVICVVRDGEIIPIGGHALLSEVKKIESVLLYQKEKLDTRKGIVKYVSTYKDEEIEFEVGNTVTFEPNCEFKNTIEGNEYLCIRKEYITSVIN